MNLIIKVLVILTMIFSYLSLKEWIPHQRSLRSTIHHIKFPLLCKNRGGSESLCHVLCTIATNNELVFDDI